jgi:hypothetical protein
VTRSLSIAAVAFTRLGLRVRVLALVGGRAPADVHLILGELPVLVTPHVAGVCTLADLLSLCHASSPTRTTGDAQPFVGITLES